MKHLTISFAFCLLLAGCGGGSEQAECRQDYWDGTFGTCLPEGWMVMDRETLRMRGIPEETTAAFRSEVSVSGQFPSVTVTQEALNQDVGPADYSKASVRSVSILPGYTLVDSPSIEIDGEELDLHIFTAQPVEDEPARRFYQVSTVKDSVGYTITAAVPLFVEKGFVDQIILIFENATFAEVSEE